MELHHLQDSEQYSPNPFLGLTQAGRVPRVFYDKVPSQHRFLIAVRFQKQVRVLRVLFPRTIQLNSWCAPLPYAKLSGVKLVVMETFQSID